ncbi:MAG: hypothetical protein IT165_21985 [Bryobacterales bacterium]|nr:hypothetical protein [Bryobacterales bacterium]
MRLVVLCLIGGGLLSGQTIEENRKAIRKTIALLEKGEDNQSKFLFVRRREVREFDSQGQVKFSESHTIRREMVDGHVITRLIARNGEALSAEEQKRQDTEIQTQVASMAGQPPKPAPKVKNEEAEIIRELPDALDYRPAGTEKRSGREAVVYEFQQRPAYKPKKLKFRMFEKVRGKCWIDKETGELMLVDAVVFDDVNIGFGVLGRIAKGTEFRMERREAAPGWWVVEAQKIKYDARVLVKALRREVDIRYSEFQLRD